MKKKIAAENAKERARLHKVRQLKTKELPADVRGLADQVKIAEARAEVEKISAEIVQDRYRGHSDVAQVFERLMGSLTSSLDYIEQQEVLASDLERPGLFKQKMLVISRTRSMALAAANLYESVQLKRDYDEFCKKIYGVMDELPRDHREWVIKRLNSEVHSG